MDTKYACSKCLKTYQRRDHCVVHIRTHDADYVRKNLICECGRTYSALAAKRRHQRLNCPVYKANKNASKNKNLETTETVIETVAESDLNSSIEYEDDFENLFDENYADLYIEIERVEET